MQFIKHVEKYEEIVTTKKIALNGDCLAPLVHQKMEATGYEPMLSPIENELGFQID